jgi:hypothetical protein
MATIHGFSQPRPDLVIKRMLEEMDKERAKREAAEIKYLEGQGLTGRTCRRLDILNRRQTDRLSDEQIVDLVHEREAQGKPTRKLRAAARLRGIDP